MHPTKVFVPLETIRNYKKIAFPDEGQRPANERLVCPVSIPILLRRSGRARARASFFKMGLGREAYHGGKN